jgi:hypothetical protein
MHSGAFSCLNADFALKIGLKQQKTDWFLPVGFLSAALRFWLV